MKKLPDSLINFILALLSAVLLFLAFPNLIFPAFGLPWLAPLALTPLLIAVAREPRPLWRFLLGEFAGIVYWLGVCYWIQFVLEVHGGMGRWGGWGTFALFCVAKALHLAVFSLLAGVLVGTSVAVPCRSPRFGLASSARTARSDSHGWRSGNAGIDMPLPLRLAPCVGVYGLSFVFAATAVIVTLDYSAASRRQLVLAR